MSLLFRPRPLLKRLNPFDYFISTSQVSVTCFGYRSDYTVPELVMASSNQGDDSIISSLDLPLYCPEWTKVIK